jgi:alpha-beta hydrolase superfamily lysophospholipase
MADLRRVCQLLVATMRLAALVGMTVSLVAACSTPQPDGPKEWKGQPLPRIAAQAEDARGSIVQSEPLNTLQPDVLSKVGAARTAVYRSVSATTGQGTEVSGTFLLPKGDPPEGGWPVIAYAHGTTGLTADCGPSVHPDLLGYDEAVGFMVGGGFAVAFTDFEGLGHGGRHPYLEPRTAGFNVIDSVRALRNLFPDVSTRWMALGGSQGGQASWAANEYAHDYGAGLDLVGSIALAPAADMSGLAAAARNGSLTRDQVALMPLVIAGLEVTSPDLVEADYLRGPAAEHKNVLMSCSPDKQRFYADLAPDQVRPATQPATDHLARLLQADALPQRTLTAPMLVVNGGADALIPPSWTAAAVSRACALGGTIQHEVREGSGHTDLQLTDSDYQWAQDRFSGDEAPSNCVTDR